MTDEETTLTDDVTTVSVTAAAAKIDETPKRDRIRFLGIVVFFFTFALLSISFIDFIVRDFVFGIVACSVCLLLWVACFVSWLIN